MDFWKIIVRTRIIMSPCLQNDGSYNHFKVDPI
jgi:hypothetical protein